MTAANVTISPADVEKLVAAIAGAIKPVVAQLPIEKTIVSALPEVVSVIQFVENFTGATLGEQLLLAVIQGLEDGLK